MNKRQEKRLRKIMAEVNLNTRTFAEFAEECGVNRDAIYKAAEAGKLNTGFMRDVKCVILTGKSLNYLNGER